MSKMDNLRAMREAKYAETVKRTAAAAKGSGAKAPGAKATPAPRPAVSPKPQTAAHTAAPAEATDGAEPALCGHRNMSGRSCTREHGHSAKSHRYS